MFSPKESCCDPQVALCQSNGCQGRGYHMINGTREQLSLSLFYIFCTKNCHWILPLKLEECRLQGVQKLGVNATVSGWWECYRLMGILVDNANVGG